MGCRPLIGVRAGGCGGGGGGRCAERVAWLAVCLVVCLWCGQGRQGGDRAAHAVRLVVRLAGGWRFPGTIVAWGLRAERIDQACGRRGGWRCGRCVRGWPCGPWRRRVGGRRGSTRAQVEQPALAGGGGECYDNQREAVALGGLPERQLAHEGRHVAQLRADKRATVDGPWVVLEQKTR